MIKGIDGKWRTREEDNRLHDEADDQYKEAKLRE